MKKRIICLLLVLMLFSGLCVHAEPVSNIYGDINKDNLVNTEDAKLLMEQVITDTIPQYIEYSDVDGSGKVTLTDARFILKYAVSLINLFPCEGKDDAIYIGSDRQVLWDDYIVDNYRTTASLTLKSPQKDSTPVIIHNKPWEGDGSNFHVIVKDVDENNNTFYRLYYNGRNMSDYQIRICYAYSYDGLNWVKPSLGIYDFNGSTANNIILGENKTEQFDNFFVFKDTNPDCDKNEKYKAVAASFISAKATLYCWTSSDGIHWQKSRAMTTDGAFDSVNTAFWDEKTQQYYCYYRYAVNGVRAIKVMVSKDFLNWAASEPVTYNDSYTFAMYTNNVQKYYRSPQVFVGFPTRYVQRSEWTENFDNLCSYELRKKLFLISNRYALSTTDALFILSHDGKNFNRFAEAWSTPGPERDGSWVYGDCYFAYGMIETPKTDGSGNELSMYAFEGHWSGGATSLYRYTIRLDGFACYESTYKAQKLVTKPIIFEGNELEINFATSAAGSIYIRLLDEDGKYLGYTTCELFGDSTNRKLSFQGTDLSQFAQKPVRLEFIMSDAEIYSFKFN